MQRRLALVLIGLWVDPGRAVAAARLSRTRSRPSVSLQRAAPRASADAEWPEPRAAGVPERATAQSIVSCAALVAGTTVGAGALALPGATAPCGFVPSAAALLLGWALMASSGLLVAEVTVGAARKTGDPGVGLLAATTATLGARAGALVGAGCALVQLALLCAYTAQGGADIAGALAGASGAPPPAFVGPCLFTAGLGGCAALGGERVLGAINGALVAALLASFAALLALAAPAVSAEQLVGHRHWELAAGAFPICVLSLVFHNVVPAVTRALRGEVRAIRLAILGGSALPLCMFLMWEAAVLGAQPPAAAQGALGADAFAADPLAPLRALGEGSGLARGAIPAFSVSAVGTSYLGFCIGQHDVLVDALRIRRGDRPAELGAYALALVPPLAVACVLPEVFAPALDAAGTFGVSTLYALLPAMLAWRQRAAAEAEGAALGGHEQMLPGGRAALVAIGATALGIVGEGTLDRLGLVGT